MDQIIELGLEIDRAATKVGAAVLAACSSHRDPYQARAPGTPARFRSRDILSCSASGSRRLTRPTPGIESERSSRHHVETDGTRSSKTDARGEDRSYP